MSARRVGTDCVFCKAADQNPESDRIAMRLVQYTQPSTGSTSLTPGVLLPLNTAHGQHTHVLDLTAALTADGHPGITSMRMLLEADLLERARQLASSASASASGRDVLALNAVRLGPPIMGCEKVLCVGMNYREHCTEQNFPIPTEPVIFSKWASSICGDGDPIPYDTDVTNELDFEVELTIVMGKRARRVPSEAALDCIAGWTVAHDVSARDVQLKRNGGQWLLGKCGDGFAPIGPTIVTRDEGAAFADASALGLRCRINGVTMQDSTTEELIFSPAEIVAYVSKYMTLMPGDLILTGTPSGVGVFRKPPVYLKDGDVCEVEIDGIGKLTNTVRAVGGGATAVAEGPGGAKRAKL